MSGGHYEYAYFQLERLADDIESDFKKNGKYIETDYSVDGDFSYKSRPDKEFDRFENYTFEEKMATLKEIKLMVNQLRSLSKKAKSLEWAMSGDTKFIDFIEDCDLLNLEAKTWDGE